MTLKVRLETDRLASQRLLIADCSVHYYLLDMSHPEPTEAELKVYFEAALEVSKAAGELILTAFKQPVSRVHFKDATDLVTDTDRACEEVVLSTLKKKFPSHLFVGEEVRKASQDDILCAPSTWL